MKRTRILSILLCLLLLACQPTPEHEAVVPPDGYESAIQKQQDRTAYDPSILPPEHWSEVMELPYWNITIDADVSPNAAGTVPVYESAYLTMDDLPEQADKVKRTLVRDATAVSDAVFTKADWYWQIQLYADTPVWDEKTGDYTRYPTDTEVDAYRRDLSSFIDTAPNEQEYRPFSPATDAIPNDALYLLSDGTLARMRCDTKDLYIYYGAELFFNVFDQTEPYVLQGGALLGEPAGTTIEGVTVDRADAEAQALSLLQSLSLDGFKVASAEKARFVNEYTRTNVAVGWRVTLGRAEGDYETAGNTIPHKLYHRSDPADGASYRPYWNWEEIQIFVDQTGVRSFWWTHPTKRPRLVNEAVEILPFEEVQEIIWTHLNNLLSWEEDNPIWREDYAGRSKNLVAHVGLYFGIIPKKNDVDTFYYGPVWIVTVQQYPADADVPALPYLMASSTRYLHINAIDGSLLSYHT